MGVARVWKAFAFEAAHLLKKVPHGHKCGRQHGHSYRVEIEATGEIDEQSGMVIDYANIALVADPIIQRLDHQNLNSIFDGAGRPWSLAETTAENVARFILSQLPEFVTAVRVFETARTGVEVKR